MRVYVRSTLPVGRNRLKSIKLSSDIKILVADKIEGMCKRFYLESSGHHVSNLLSFFSVPKGETDIRVVCDGTSCGLSNTLWAPNFFLPSATSAAMLLTFGTWMADMDFGEMFHNFPMEERMQRCSAVELRQEQAEEDEQAKCYVGPVYSWVCGPVLSMMRSDIITGERNLLVETRRWRTIQWVTIVFD